MEVMYELAFRIFFEKMQRNIFSMGLRDKFNVMYRYSIYNVKVVVVYCKNRFLTLKEGHDINDSIMHNIYFNSGHVAIQ